MSAVHITCIQLCVPVCLCLTMSRLIFLHSIAEFVLKASIFRTIFRRHESEHTCFHIDKLFLSNTLHFIAYITQNIICLFVLLLLFNKFGIGIQTSKIMCTKDLVAKNHQARGVTEPPKMGGRNHQYGGNKPPYLCGGLLPPKSVAYLGQGKSTKIGGIFPPPFLQCKGTLINHALINCQ